MAEEETWEVEATVEEAINRQRKAHLMFLKEVMYEFRSHKVPESCLREMETNWFYFASCAD